MKKKVKIGLFVFIVVGVVILNITYKNKNEVIKTKRKRQNNLAIMIKEDGASDYTKSSSKDIPIGSYILNRDKSYCKNNGVIGDYDSTLGKVSFSFIGTDSCYLYFDYSSGPTINDAKVNNKVLTATLLSDVGLTGYQITSVNREPQTWNEISGTEYALSVTLTEPGNYYLWVKDKNDSVTNVSGSSYIYMSMKDYIVKKYENNTIVERTDFSDVYDDVSHILYKTTATQDNSVVYYYAGNAKNNWVKFEKYAEDWYGCKNYDGSRVYSSTKCSNDQEQILYIAKGSDMYWRIIRTTEDGGIKLLYAGTNPQDLNVTIANDIIFNPYKLYLTSQNKIVYNRFNTSGEQPNSFAAYFDGGVENDDDSIYESSFKVNDRFNLLPRELLNIWSNNLMLMVNDENIYSYSSSMFCNEVEKNDVYYNGYYRIDNNGNVSPSLKCSDGGKINSWIGLITADELIFAGGSMKTRNYNKVYYNINSENQNYQNSWWTMTPSYTDGIEHYVYAVEQSSNTYYNGVINPYGTNQGFGIRPVISLNKCTYFVSGNGYEETPYEIGYDIVNSDLKCPYS